MPSSHEDWIAVADGFERIGGMPNVAGAIDGTLIEIERPADYLGI